ncbi:MAG: hypothetical protein RMA76_23400, partial [Deltaproteobacteria bacterium]
GRRRNGPTDHRGGIEIPANDPVLAAWDLRSRKRTNGRQAGMGSRDETPSSHALGGTNQRIHIEVARL